MFINIRLRRIWCFYLMAAADEINIVHHLEFTAKSETQSDNETMDIEQQQKERSKKQKNIYLMDIVRKEH